MTITCPRCSWRVHNRRSMSSCQDTDCPMQTVIAVAEATSDDYVPTRFGDGREESAPREAQLARDPARGFLNDRGSTHGDFEENGKIMQALKEVVRAHWGWQKLTPYQREAIEMIQHKIGRILCGNCNYYDHWRDIGGYAKIVEERLPHPEQEDKK